MEQKRRYSMPEVKEINTNFNSHSKSKPSSSSSDLLKNSSIHGSMENIHHPRNYRSRGRGGCSNGGSSKSSKTSSQYGPSPPAAYEHSLPGPSRQLQLFGGCSQVAEGNRELCELITQQKQQALVRKVVSIFLFGALKKQSKRVVELEALKRFKTEESAARLILHTLLLNSWRTAKEELERLAKENSQLSISVDNLGLQLRVVRHLQASEKDRASEKANEIRILKSQLNHSQQAQKNVEEEFKSMEEELRYAREDNEKLVAQRDDVKQELERATADKEAVMRAMEIEKRRANRAEDDLHSLKLQVTDLKKQARDLTVQCSQWQERAREFESTSWEMKLNLETRDQALAVRKTEYELLVAEKEEIMMKKNAMHQAYNEVNEKLTASLESNCILQDQFNQASNALEAQTRKQTALEMDLQELISENREIRSELYDFKLKNVRSRRAWVSAIRYPSKLWSYLVNGSQPRSVGDSSDFERLIKSQSK